MRDAEPDLRFLQATERTRLACLRTGLAFMALGFVIARLAVWLRLEHPERDGSAGSTWLGLAAVALGVRARIATTSVAPKARLDQITRLVPSSDEPSVWVPRADATELIEVNFIGLDPAIVEPSDTYEKQDDRLPLMVFGPLSLLTAGSVVEIDDLRIPLPQPAGLALEKLVSDRTGDKGDRDLLVVAGLLAIMAPADLDQLECGYLGLSAELRHQVRSNLSILSLLDARPGMPDPRPRRPVVDALLHRLVAR